MTPFQRINLALGMIVLAVLAAAAARSAPAHASLSLLHASEQAAPLPYSNNQRK
jgi:hypothetical protein